MPNIVAHYICGKLVSKKLNIKNINYLKGNLYPDYVDKERHYRMKGKMFDIPDIERFIKYDKITDKYLKIGFLTHLMLDKLFLDDFVINKIYNKLDKNVNVFTADKIYNDYSIISSQLLNHYNISIDNLNDIMIPEKNNIDFLKYKKDIDLITASRFEKLKYLNLESFIEFLDTSSEHISEYLEKNNFI